MNRSERRGRFAAFITSTRGRRGRFAALATSTSTRGRRGRFAALVAVLLLSLLPALGMGAVRLSPADILRGLSDSRSVSGRILLYARLPRILAALSAGAGLSVSGVLIQTVLANPLASPGIIGINAGAGLFTAAAMAFLPGAALILPGAAFLGALCTALSVFGIARCTGASKITLVLSGVAVSGLMTAGISALTVLFPEIMAGMHDFQIGGFTGVSASAILPAVALILAGLAASLLFAGELEILGLGEETALSLGLRVRPYRFLFLSLSAALCGAAVSYGGLIGFVGLIVPHAARMLFPGAGKRALIAASCLMGAAFLLLCDTAACSLFSPFELPVGIPVSFMGAPFFLRLILKERRRRHD
jgi:iron complex transport system permease protein